MRIILVGAPGSGKAKAVEAVLAVDTVEVVGDFDELSMAYDVQIGDLADYRTEIALAGDRALQGSRDGFFTYSLLDSVAHIAVRLNRILRTEAASQDAKTRWLLTAHLVTTMLVDTFKADHVLYLPGNDGTDHSRKIEEALLELMDEMDIPYDTLTSPEEAATLVRKYGQRDGNTEPDAAASSE